jgi:hypothetical protein
MSSAAPGPSTSRIEVTHVSKHGFWLFLGERELFLWFAEFPWFREAAIGALTNVQLPSPHHLYWPDLDIDLAVESIEHPEKYPLVSQAQPKGVAADEPCRERCEGPAQGRPVSRLTAQLSTHSLHCGPLVESVQGPGSDR